MSPLKLMKEMKKSGFENEAGEAGEEIETGFMSNCLSSCP
jgi:hypothetical protein